MNEDRSTINGWLNVFKEQGYTSSHIVRTLKKKFNIKKIGHAGTLDPNAEGILPIAINKTTKLIPFVSANSKKYCAWLSSLTASVSRGSAINLWYPK